MLDQFLGEIQNFTKKSIREILNTLMIVYNINFIHLTFQKKLFIIYLEQNTLCVYISLEFDSIFYQSLQILDF